MPRDAITGQFPPLRARADNPLERDYSAPTPDPAPNARG